MDLELSKTEARYHKQQLRLEKDFSWSSTTGPMAIASYYIGDLIVSVDEYLKPTKEAEVPFINLIKDLPKETIALCCLSGGLNAIGHNAMGSFTKTLTIIGKNLEAECYAHQLLQHDADMAERLEKLARMRHGNLKYRQRAVRSIARKNKFTVPEWSNKQRIVAGNWAVNFLTTALPQVFSLSIEKDGKDKALLMTEEAFSVGLAAVEYAIHAYPVYLPSKVSPRPWTDWNIGGPRDSRFQHKSTVLRSLHSETAAYVRSNIATGTMQPALDALNLIQGVGWRINKRVLEVMKWCHVHTVPVKSLPRARDIDLPDRSKPWDDMSESEQKAWKIRANQAKLKNRGFSSERVLFHEDMTTAELLEGEGVFYTPCNMDWRGRVYPLTHFNYQREDRVRSLFEFANGVEMTPESLYWLKVHVANVGDYDKISKKSFDERVAWVDTHLERLRMVAETPEFCHWWHDADKPFQFLAACIELQAALDNPKHITHLPIAFDGSCSGLQHLSAMTRAAEGSLVNLTKSDHPQDVYSIVAERVEKNLHTLLYSPNSSETEKNLCRLSLDYGITRSLVKRNVMTYGYSSQKFGMGSQLQEDLMQPLALEVLAGERKHHPFGNDGGFTASRFLASHIFDAIEEVVKKPAEAMDFLRHLAKALAHENKPVTWITPVGVPWINRYHDRTVSRVSLWLCDKGVNLPHTVGVATGWRKQINKSKAANGIAPNFVHALDAAHLMMTVNGLNDVGITDIALVHDSFAVHAPNASKLRDVLRTEFVRLYTEFDPLNDILECNRDRMSNQSRLPQPVAKGPLDIKEVLNAEYAFS